MARKIPMKYGGAVYPLMALRLREEDWGRRPKMGEKKVLAWCMWHRKIVGRRWLSQRLWIGQEFGMTRAVRWVKANHDVELKRLKAQLLKGVTE